MASNGPVYPVTQWSCNHVIILWRDSLTRAVVSKLETAVSQKIPPCSASVPFSLQLDLVPGMLWTVTSIAWKTPTPHLAL